MASLKNGVLLKLLDDMKTEDNPLDETERKPVLLQIRSIVPVLEEGDLWPNRGFFLKVSDSSHALYVSLPDEQNEMILENRLKLGQLIYVQKLENAHPVPVLCGVTPVPGRRPCNGGPEDIISPASLVKLLEASSQVESIVEKGVILEKKVSSSRKLIRGMSDSESLSERLRGGGGGYRGRFRSLSAAKARPGEMRTEKSGIRISDFEKGGFGFDGMGEWSDKKSRPSSVDNDSDVESVVSSASSTRVCKRRSWNESEILGVKEIFDSSVVKHEIKPPRSRSANVSPVRSVSYDSSDDNSSTTSRRRNVTSTRRLIKSGNKSQTLGSKVNSLQMSSSLCALVHEKKGAEFGISWNSLPSNLAKLGKEVVRQRDVALHAAVDALQEACAAERLLSCLSTLSEFPLAEGDNLQPYVDKLFELQDDLARTRLIMQSLTSISPFRTAETESCSNTNSVKEVLTIALERNKNATAWIKSAVALDLSVSSTPPLTNPIPITKGSTKKSSASSHSDKPKGALIVKKNRTSADFLPFVLASEKEDQTEWTKGSTLCAGSDLASSLQDECRKLLLSYVEKYLDEVERKGTSMQPDEEQMAGMMYKVKMVSDWLDMIVNKEGKDEGGVGADQLLGDSDTEAYGRVRNKIYGILLKHVERTAMAYKASA